MTERDGNAGQALSLFASARTGRQIFRRAVLRVLDGMPHGRLTIELPDGDVRTFGSGSNPAASRHGLNAQIAIRSDNFFRRCFFFGDIGFAESYMAGEWETNDLAEVIAWFILNESPRRGPNLFAWLNKAAHKLRANTRANSRRNIAAHYDLSNEFFALFLDPSMTYSSGLFESEEATLDAAQVAKYERICRMLEINPTDRVLEIGGGWGALSRHIAKRYGCRVTTITISQQQYDWASRRICEEHLSDRIDLRLIDYRQLDGTFDKIVSVEMLEAVGHDFFDTFFSKCDQVLAPNGLIALQVITCPEWRCESMRASVDFIQKHVFPGGEVPSVGCLLGSVRRSTALSLAELYDFGQSYARTLQVWAAAFESRLDEVRSLGFDDAFLRKWRYYFRYCEAGFLMRHISVVQMLLSRSNNHARMR